MALGDIHLHFAWQAWRLLHWARSGGALWGPLVAGDALAICVVDVALGNIYLRFAWQAWRLAGVALGDIPLHSAWQAWHLWQWAWSAGALRALWSAVTLRHFVWQVALCEGLVGEYKAMHHVLMLPQSGRLAVTNLDLSNGCFDLGTSLCMCSCTAQTDVLLAVTLLARGAWGQRFRPSMMARAMGRPPLMGTCRRLAHVKLSATRQGNVQRDFLKSRDLLQSHALCV